MKLSSIKWSLSLVFFASVLFAGQTAIAERTKVIVILDIEAAQGVVPAPQLAQLTDSIYAAATEVSPEYFSVISRDKLLSILSSSSGAAEGQGKKTPAEIGALLGADMLFSGELSQTNAVRFNVTLRLVETGSGRILGLERAEAQDLDALWGEMRKVSRQMLLPLAAPSVEAGPSRIGGELKPGQATDFLIQFRTAPTGAQIEVNDREICEETPCSYRLEPGDHTVLIRAANYKTQRQRIIVDRDQELVFNLERKEYNYFGMQDAEQSGFGITVGMSPVETDYKIISVMSGSKFSNLHPIFDVGANGEIFGYRQMPRDRSWSIFGFGPSIRAGRLILSAEVQLLSFRIESDRREGGWQPGVTTRIQIPLVNSREVGKWANLIPTPAAGLDVWFDDLDYDQYHVWLGLSWLGGVAF